MDLRDGDTVLFSAVASRRKVLNLTRDPRVSLTVFDIANPYQSVELRGTAAGQRLLRLSHQPNGRGWRLARPVVSLN